MDTRQYPAYFLRTDGALIAITSRTTMYIVHKVGSNTGNQGVTLDHYITRKQVLKHYGDGKQIDLLTYRERFNLIFNSYLEHIINS